MDQPVRDPTSRRPLPAGRISANRRLHGCGQTTTRIPCPSKRRKRPTRGVSFLQVDRSGPRQSFWNSASVVAVRSAADQSAGETASGEKPQRTQRLFGRFMVLRRPLAIDAGDHATENLPASTLREPARRLLATRRSERRHREKQDASNCSTSLTNACLCPSSQRLSTAGRARSPAADGKPSRPGQLKQTTSPLP